jgi:hypothetical protein
MSYQLLIVADAKSMMPATAEAIRDFAKGGGKVVFVNRTPDRAPGLRDAGAGDDLVRAATDDAIHAGAVRMSGPPDGCGLGALRDWTLAMLNRVRAERALAIRAPQDGLYSLHHRAPDAEVFFFANTYRRESSRSRVDFALGESGRGLWRWNPETGERTPYELPWDTAGFEIDLRPLESVLLVTGPKQDPKPRPAPSGDRPAAFTLATPWHVTFHPIRTNETFTRTMPALADFTARDDPLVRRFSGTAVYQTTFRLDETPYTTLDLGWDNDFISEVELNGHKLGVNWYGSRRFDLQGALEKGENHLTIRYTTTLWNAMKDRDLQPSGLIGHVTLR